MFSNIEVYTYNQQTYNPNGLSAHTSYISSNFKWAVSDYSGKEVLHCEGYYNEEFSGDIMMAPLSELYPQGE